MADLREHLSVISDIAGASAVLGWDQQTYMPPGGVTSRGYQLTALSTVLHERGTSPELGKLISKAEQETLEGVDQAIVREARRDYDLATKLPLKLVQDLTRTTTAAHQVWEEARKSADFTSFAPHLEKIVKLSREVADCYGYVDTPYDALIDIYEPGMRTVDVRTLFATLKERLVPLAGAVLEKADPDADAPLRQPFTHDDQLAFGWPIVTGWGLDASRSRQDEAAHPFCTHFGSDDVRITTHVKENHLSFALFSTFHEAGHAMYEQGVDVNLARTTLDRGTSLGVHESQSRMWENLVGRSRPFWDRHYASLQQTFPQLQSTNPDEFYLAINAVKRSLIRTEADELSYNLHVLLRFELEEALVRGEMAVSELPEAWGDGMERLLGVRPSNDAEGVLQDVHWSGGMIGYFPTYTIGNVMAVQLWQAAHQDAHVAAGVAKAEYAPLLKWLREHVHRHGATLRPAELLKSATGRQLDPAPYLDYLEQKFSNVYELRNP